MRVYIDRPEPIWHGNSVFGYEITIRVGPKPGQAEFEFDIGVLLKHLSDVLEDSSIEPEMLARLLAHASPGLGDPECFGDYVLLQSTPFRMALALDRTTLPRHSPWTGRSPARCNAAVISGPVDPVRTWAGFVLMISGVGPCPPDQPAPLDDEAVRAVSRAAQEVFELLSSIDTRRS